ncbi:GlxA family transcriptional regulator [Chitinophaga niabensis]|uniref:Transcriptional regulator GlxA family, contains an amidase domain and an AraC-type DNA-binding HTH domain n=1 Tax=Chitinophaga niabensis TaxID=536979 RepID=A0A1N6J078_9BACT|nr:helix-turn-helix domain-containing protein [Chitinophaga niabensis]SIO37655.1 Transcriptional regulator GlxA family, contains an amidase domain and an AraC-type DNA-binding HTH domain [Chitinophaga niabensis]
MKKLCFLIPDGTLKPTTLFGVIEVFEKANIYATENGKEPFYEIILAGVQAKQIFHNSMLSIITDSIQSIKAPDLIFIPPIEEIAAKPVGETQVLLEWMVDQYHSGTEIASLCTGAFLLAYTGLLKDKDCATHWRAESLFIKMFPDTKLLVDKIMTDKKGIYTAGGASSSLNLALYIVEKHHGRDTALFCAKLLEIDIERNSQSQFILFEGQKNHADDGIREIQEFIEKNVEEKLSVDFLAEKFSISRRSLVRRFKKATNNPPIEYIQRVKIEVAKRCLESGKKTINEIMYAVGYNDVKAFREVFKKIAGLTPIEYRAKYSSYEMEDNM